MKVQRLVLGTKSTEWFQFGQTSHLNSTFFLALTAWETFPLLNIMGNAISPRGDMLKNRVQLHRKDAPCLPLKLHPPRNLRD